MKSVLRLSQSLGQTLGQIPASIAHHSVVITVLGAMLVLGFVLSVFAVITIFSSIIRPIVGTRIKELEQGIRPDQSAPAL